MPGTLWSAPVPALNTNTLTVSSFTTATLTDLSPAQVVLLPGQMNLGTRIRLRAYGGYTATTTASAVTWGFYMAQVGQPITAAGAVALAATPSTAVAVATAWPVMLEWEGQIRAVTSPLVGATNAQVMGQGKAFLPTSLTAWTPVAMPATAAARTVQQGGTPGFGLVTNTAQLVSVGVTVATNTGLTSITFDELTCELLG